MKPLPSLVSALFLVGGLLLLGPGCISPFDSTWEPDDDSAGGDDDADDDTGDDDTGDDDTGGGPDIEVAPDPIGIKDGVIGTPSHEDMVIRNVGDAPLEVWDIVVTEDGGGVITVDGWTGTIHDGSQEILIEQVHALCLQAGPALGTIEVLSNDPDENPYAIEVGVVCTGAAAE